MQTPALWIQQAHAEKTIGFVKVPGKENPSDVLTKHVPFTLLNEHLVRMHLEVKGGRVESAHGLNYLRPAPWAVNAAADGFESHMLHDKPDLPAPKQSAPTPKDLPPKDAMTPKDTEKDKQEEQCTLLKSISRLQDLRPT